jgi:hypothetical protein
VRRPSESARLRSELAQTRAEVAHLRDFLARLCESLQVDPPEPIIGVDILQPKDVVFITGLSRSMVQKHMDSGRYTVVMRGGRRFIDPASLRAVQKCK